MECNKEEAIRAKEIAERRMQEGDYEAAKKIALKAQKLYPEIENISQLLIVCDVHCSAKNKINGTEMDWYGILQVERFSDKSVIFKQFRNLALLLHPDKNQLPGAESAFKMIEEARRFLTDATKRQIYDMKCRGMMRYPGSSSAYPSSNIHVMNHVAPKFSNVPKNSNISQQPQRPTFWTCCSSCNMRYEYYKELQNKTLRCQSCKQAFVACDTGTNDPAMPGFSTSQSLNQKGGQNQGLPKVNIQRLDPMIKTAKANEMKSGNISRIWGFSGQRDRADVHVKVKPWKEGGTSTNIPASLKRKGSETVTTDKRKRERKSEGEPVVVLGIASISAQNSRANGVHQPKRSSRYKHHIPSQEEINTDDVFISSPNILKGNSSSAVTKEGMKEKNIGSWAPFEGSSYGCVAATVNVNNEVKQKTPSSTEKGSPVKRGEKHDGMANGEEACVSRKADEKVHDNGGNSQVDESDADAKELEPKLMQYPDPQFNDFDVDKTEGSFAVNQLWAIYDNTDGMPRFYARIKKVFSPGFKLLITWLEPNSDIKEEQSWFDNELPVACGKFKNGETEGTVDCLMFSHRMECLNGHRKGTYLVYPRKGETWALFRDWDLKWNLEPEKHRPHYKFEYAEILSDYIEGVGITIAYLSKVKGFVSLFLRVDEVDCFCIPPDELYRFSHRIPSFRMTGKEAKGVPTWSFEFDPASISSDPGIFSNLNGVELEKESLNGKINDSFCKSANIGDAKPKKGFDNVPMPKETENSHRNGPMRFTRSARKLHAMCKNEEVDPVKLVKEKDASQVVYPDNQSHPNGTSPSYQANERLRTTTKKVKAELTSGSFILRRSPRDISKGISQVNPIATRSKSEDTDKHTTADKMHINANDRNSTDLKVQQVSFQRKVVKVDSYNFESERAEDKFQLDQIWALSSDEDGLPNKYVQIKKIETRPHFKLHVAMLETCSQQKDKNRPISCGYFNVTNQRKVLPRAQFSHRVKAIPICKNKFDIQPRKGEVWAMYRSRLRKTSCLGVEDFNMIEVLEETEQGVKVVYMRRSDSESFYIASKGSIKDIPQSEFSRFSHQCLAIQHFGDDSFPGGIWQLDRQSIPGNLVILD